MDLLDAVLLVGATARLTRLTVIDTIAGPARAGFRWAAATVAGPAGYDWADELVSCPHCAAVWAAAVTVAAWAAWPNVWRVVAAVLTVAYAAGHMVAHFDGQDDE